MKKLMVIWLVFLIIASPVSAQAFGLLQYVFDGIANQLGLDRGPIPKAPRKCPYDPLCRNGQGPCAPPQSSARLGVHIHTEGY